jgi:hypothetical protein
VKYYGRIDITGLEEIKETFKRRQWGPISWYERLSCETIGSDLVINIDRKVRNIYLNGVKVEICATGGKGDFSNPPSINIVNQELLGVSHEKA